jgi:transmembrane sensor
MKEHPFSELENFLEDESFRRWVYDSQPQDNLFWQNWLHLHPEKMEVVEQARQYLLAVRGDRVFLPEDHIDQRVAQLVERAGKREGMPKVHQPAARSLWPVIWRVAASVVLLIGLGWWGYRAIPAQPVASTAYQQLVERSALPLLEEANHTDQPQLITLPDGSTVRLGKNSSLSYPAEFDESERVVYLSGEAYFEVKKNPAAPFLVYANELVTKVLGTSFTVQAHEKQQDVTVVVHTGKVSVFANPKNPVSRQKNNRELTEIILLPNQQAVLLREEMRVVRSLVEDPAVIIPPANKQVFKFKRTPVAEVYAALEKAYEVKIVFDEEVMSNCTLTASLEDETLFEKLRWICASTESSYQVVDGQIVISGQGCN